MSIIVLYDYDFHIHTELCGHAPGQKIEKILARANELGLDTIVITEHIFDPDDLRTIERIRVEVSRIKTRCRVIIGAEIDVDRNAFDGRLGLDSRSDIDYVIGTIHYMPGTDVMPHCQEPRPLTPNETFTRWRSTILGLVSNPLVDTLAHPGAMIANALPDDDFPACVMETFADAASISAKSGIAWELNNLTGRKLTQTQREQYPDVLQLALDAGVRLIYSSDAHKPEDIAGTSFVSQVLAGLSDKSCLDNGLEFIDMVLAKEKGNPKGLKPRRIFDGT